MRIRNSNHNFIAQIIFVSLILITVMVLFDRQIRPIINEIVTFESKQLAVIGINEAVSTAINSSEDNFDNYVKIKYNSNDDISSVATDVNKINLFQSEISKEVNNKFKGLSNGTVEFSSGTLSGISYLNGRGPKIKVKLNPIGYAETTLASKFSSLGVNQTNHQIILTVNAKLSAVLPWEMSNIDVSVDYILSDTVIVGNVPESYTYIAGDNRDIIPKINDYATKN
ncbi:MAG: sporulation protein YunB [Oscillospiraceae bacterium]